MVVGTMELRVRSHESRAEESYLLLLSHFKCTLDPLGKYYMSWRNRQGRQMPRSFQQGNSTFCSDVLTWLLFLQISSYACRLTVATLCYRPQRQVSEGMFRVFRLCSVQLPLIFLFFFLSADAELFYGFTLGDTVPAADVELLEAILKDNTTFRVAQLNASGEVLTSTEVAPMSQQDAKIAS